MHKREGEKVKGRQKEKIKSGKGREKKDVSILFDCIREKIERKAEKVKESWERGGKQGRGKKGEERKGARE